MSNNLWFLEPQWYVASFSQFQLSGFVREGPNTCSVKITYSTNESARLSLTFPYAPSQLLASEW